MAKELTITVKILLEAEEEELFEATDEESLIGQADLVTDYLRQPADRYAGGDANRTGGGARRSPRAP